MRSMKALGCAVLALALTVAACATVEKKIADVAGDEVAAVVVDAGCFGAAEFADVTVGSGMTALAVSLLKKGINKSCAARTNRDRVTIAATVYDTPVDAFCAVTRKLTPETEPDAAVRTAFNSALDETCKKGGAS